VESITQAVCDLALRFGEGADGQEAIMVNFIFYCIYLHYFYYILGSLLLLLYYVLAYFWNCPFLMFRVGRLVLPCLLREWMNWDASCKFLFLFLTPIKDIATMPIHQVRLYNGMPRQLAPDLKARKQNCKNTITRSAITIYIILLILPHIYFFNLH
jgi:hypothetical protein